MDLKGTLMIVSMGVQSRLLAAISPGAWYNIGLVVVLLTLAFASYWAYQVWHEVNEEEEPATTEELLASFEQARAAGELDDEEYARVRKRIEESATSPPQTPSRKPGQETRDPDFH
jgi:uncharacterized membrane protein